MARRRSVLTRSVRTSAPVYVYGIAGWKSPSRLGLSLVTEGNCVAVRRGGEQPEVNDQSAAIANLIRPVAVASLLVNGEAQVTL